ncbi:MAG: hypothetical protein PVH73_02100 [Candidatus Bathyarchaeota archaeon]|jgi:hypothetical protein
MRKVFALLVIILILVSATAFVVHYSLFDENRETKPFYVGVTYCGNSTEEAKALIDRVKTYTNLFVLQSGPLQRNPEDINDIGNYAVSSDMHFVIYFGSDSYWLVKNWLDTYDSQWGDYFLGVYLGDELAGKMIDYEAWLWDSATNSSWLKYRDGLIQRSIDENTTIGYRQNGRIELWIVETSGSPYNNEGLPDPSFLNHTYIMIDYYPNGTIITKISDDANPLPKIVEDYNLPYTYEELLDMCPFRTYDEVAEGFIEGLHQDLLRIPINEKISTFTADYALYWFDYKASYDVVLASLGWNHTIEQDIALVRGAAELQNKTWGAIITWKYNHPPYLDSGDAIFDQMRMAYEAGAEYIVVFNYAEDMEGPYGTLQDEHFDALERFWNEVVQSSAVKHGSVKAEAVLVLPENYGWGMRNPEDKIWSLWGPDDKSQQIWELSRSLLDQYGLGLDIVYYDPEFPVAEKYTQIYYWNHTG